MVSPALEFTLKTGYRILWTGGVGKGSRSPDPQKRVELYNKGFGAAKKTGIYYFPTQRKKRRKT